MTASLTHIFRHPLKAIGREEISGAHLTAGSWLAYDRLWAVTHEAARLDGNGWAQKVNFLRGVSGPQLMAATARLDEAGGVLTLDHPEAGQFAFRPDDAWETPAFLDWLARIWPAELPAPTGVYRAAEAHLTDVPDAWISINTHASHGAVEGRLGGDLSIHRWRGNLWVEGAEPWAEFGWVGRRLSVGGAVLEVKEPITRCKATMANPETGLRDADTLAALRSWEHQDFGIYAEVVEDGRIAPGDPVRVL